MGKTLFVSSHLLNEMEIIADLMLIIDKGRKVVEGNVTELLNPDQINVELETTYPEAAAQKISDSDWAGYFLSVSDGKIVLKMKQNEIPAFIRHIAQMDIDIISVRPRHSLEDYFLSLTAH
jgi:ABC-type multidrug transport system ATPase subunit